MYFSTVITSFNARYGRIRFVLALYFLWSCSVSVSVGHSLTSICVGWSSIRSSDTGRLPFCPNNVIRIRDRCSQWKSPWNSYTLMITINLWWLGTIVWFIWLKKTPHTDNNFCTAFLGSNEYSLASIRRPSDLTGSELKPTIGFWIEPMGLALPAAKRNVPSPPIGTMMSAHLACSAENDSLKLFVLH